MDWLKLLKRKEGMIGELRIGGRALRENLLPRAWVEYDEIVLNDDWEVRQRYAMFEKAIEVKR